VRKMIAELEETGVLSQELSAKGAPPAAVATA
jgi:hypothetical protein